MAEGRAVAVDRGEEVAVVAADGGSCHAMHDVAHTNSICPDGTKPRRLAAAASLTHSPASFGLNHASQLLKLNILLRTRDSFCVLVKFIFCPMDLVFVKSTH